MRSRLLVPAEVVEATLNHVKEAGRDNSERLVLWLGERSADGIRVHDALVPDQVASSDYFRVPRESILAILDTVGARGGLIAAQVHSHPGRAFHSKADDDWAIIRHEGAFSLVLPRFARDTSVADFLEKVAVFCLSGRNQWVQVETEDVPLTLRILP